MKIDNNPSLYIQNQLSKFDELWLETSNSWPPPGFTVDKHTRKNWGLIALPKAEDWQHVCEIIDVISQSWSWNIAYTLPQLHITIGSLGTPSSWKEHEEILDAILRQATVYQDPIEVDFHGINLLRNTIIVQVIDKQDKFRKLVSEITALVKEAGLAKNLKIGIHDRLWWTSIVRLYQPIPDDIQSFVKSFRNIFLGSSVINSIKLIENNKTHDPLEVKLIDSYEFSRKRK